MQNVQQTLIAIAAAFAAGAAFAAPVGIDGVIGAEWGAPTAHVASDPAAPTSNFGTPGSTNHNVGYSVYMRTDGSYLYAAVAADGPTNGLDFANIYFNVDDLPAPGSDLGVEVTNDRFFIPNTGVPAVDTANHLQWAVGAGVVEFAISWDFLLHDPYAMGFHTASAGGWCT